MQTYKVGSILYLIPESSFMSVPAQVVEEVIRKIQQERGLDEGDRALKGSVGREINSAERVANYM